MTSWVTVAEASSVDELKATEPKIKNVPAGTRGRVIVSGLPWSSAKLFDLVLAEQTFGRYLVPKGARVIDCHEENGVGYVEFEVTGTPLVPLLIAIAWALAALGFLVVSISVAFMLVKLSPILVWGLIALGIVAVVVVVVMIARKGRIRAGPIEVGK